MKSQITSAVKIQNRGFLIMEMMIAFSIMTLFLSSAVMLSATMQSLRMQAVKELENLERFTFAPVLSDYANAWGRDSCSASFFFNPKKTFLHSSGLNISSNPSTDLEVRNGIAYFTADSPVGSSPDFYIADMRDPESPFIISSINTGPGLSALEVAGRFIYAANSGTTNQLQIIDIADRHDPVLLSTLKLPLPHASSTAPAATAIFYSRGLVYLGTKKWEGNEFSIIDVSNPASPKYLGGFETGTLINDIYARDGYAYLAASDIAQMRILDVRDPSNITQLDSFSPSGWETQEGKVFSYFEGSLSLGRTPGGFNNSNNHEVFIFSSSSPHVMEYSRDIPGGVYGIVIRPPHAYLATRSTGREFQIWDNSLENLVFEKSLGFSPRALSCDRNNLYFATGDGKGVSALIIEK
ncbi:MAG: hypothetical protein Q8Q03_01300 [bacterium]|nr:hypothetical protein [bacterium]